MFIIVKRWIVFLPIFLVMIANSALAETQKRDWQVNPDGSFKYNIPIDTPKGVGKIQPELSLEYNSNNGNGMLGIGWKLKGLPFITRMNWGKGINYTGNDTYTLSDGSRLVDVDSGRTEYHTDRESWTKFEPLFSGSPMLVGTCSIQEGYLATEPCGWLATDKQGNKYYYGTTDSSRIEGVELSPDKAGAVRVWALAKFEDTWGNDYLVEYNEDLVGGDYSPRSITYAGYTIDFGYGTQPGKDATPVVRSDSSLSYASGAKVDLDQRLQWIEVGVAGYQLKYKLEYDATDTSKLKKLTKYSADLSESITVAEFNWNEEIKGFEELTMWYDVSGANANDYVRNNGSNRVYTDIIDMNGDGLKDRVTYYDYTKSLQALNVGLNNGNGFDDLQIWQNTAGDNAGDWPSYSVSNGITYVGLIDMNNDSLLDRVSYYNHDESLQGFYVGINNGSGFDDLASWYQAPADSGYEYPKYTTTNNSVVADLVDMNGDGLLDRVMSHDGTQWGFFVGINNGSGFDFENFKDWTSASGNTANNYIKYLDANGVVYTDLIDMNGDGLPDQVTYNNGTTQGLYVGINNGSGFEPYGDPWIVMATSNVNNFPKYVTTNGSVRSDLIDMNGDGRPDRVSYYSDSTYGLFVGINNGSKFDTLKDWNPSPVTGNDEKNYPFHFGTNGTVNTELKDMNGDGLPDRVIRNNGTKYSLFVGINNRNGFNPLEEWFTQEDGNHNAYPRHGTTNSTITTDLIDINGDGLPDRVTYNNNVSPGLYVGINTGKGFESLESWIDSNSNYSNYPQYIGDANGSIYTDLIDMNGDGQLDRVTYHNGTDQALFVGLNKTSKPLLISVKNEAGASTRVEYSTTLYNTNVQSTVSASCPGKGTLYGNPCGASDASPRAIVQDLQTSDGRADTGWSENGNDTDLVTSYDYHNARVYYGHGPGFVNELTTRKDLGFEKVIKADKTKQGESWITLTTSVIENRQNALFDHDNDVSSDLLVSPFAGAPIRMSTYEGEITINGSGEVEGYLLQEVLFTYNDDLSERSLLFPQTGNSDIAQVLNTEKTLKSYETGQLASVNIKTDTFDTYGYAINNADCAYTVGNSGSPDCLYTETAYVRDSEWRFDRISSVKTSKANDFSTLVKAESITYNASSQITLIESLLCDDLDTCTEVSGTYVPTSQNRTYNNRGQLTYMENALGHGITYAYDDAGFPALLTSKTNAKNQEESYTYNEEGHLTLLSDINGNETRYEYDGLGRLFKTTDPKGYWITTTYYNWGDAENQYVEEITATDAGVKWLTRYLDGFHRIYLTEELGDEGKVIVNEAKTSYQGQVKVVESSLPVYRNETPSWTVSHYDVQNRWVKTITPKGSTVDILYGINRVTKRTLKGDTVSVYDARKRLIEQIDDLNQSLTYQYNQAGNLKITTLPNSQTVELNHDNWGRKLSLNDPSAGLMSYSYDHVGNLTGMSDAVKSFSYSYDELNRIVTRDASNDGSIIYTYDDPDVSNSKGRLTKVSQPLYSREIKSYDQKGNPTRIITKMDGLPHDFEEVINYDYANRVIQQISYDGKVRNNTYSVAGNLKEVKYGGLTYGRYSNYLASGKVGTLETNTSDLYTLTTYFTYDADELLQELTTVNGSGHKFQHNQYVFDALGNVEEITDLRPVDEMIIEDINTNISQSFEYDALNRIIYAQTPQGNKDYVYNSIGNLEQHDGVKVRDIVYSDQKATSGTDFTATYDALGNMTTKSLDGEDWEYKYNDRNQLIEVKKAGTTILNFAYDPDGNRYKKVFTQADDSTVTTWYIGQSIEIWQDSALGFYKKTRHLHGIGGKKLATITEEITGDFTAAVTPLMIIGGWLNPNHPGFLLSLMNQIQPTQQDIALLIGLACLIWFMMMVIQYVRKTQSTSGFGYYQRLAAVSMVMLLIMVGCKSGNSSSGGEDQTTQPTEQTLSNEITSSGLVKLNAEDEVPYYGSYKEVVAVMEKGVSIPSSSSLSNNQFSPTASTNHLPIGGPLPGTWFYHLDHLGSSSVMTDGRGEEATRTLYLPFGEIDDEHSTGAPVTNHKFTGQENDGESGLVYYKSRYYESSIGRFLTPDTIIPDEQNAQAYNRYTYVINNPINYTDPTGHSWLSNLRGTMVLKDAGTADESNIKKPGVITKQPSIPERKIENLFEPRFSDLLQEQLFEIDPLHFEKSLLDLFTPQGNTAIGLIAQPGSQQLLAYVYSNKFQNQRKNRIYKSLITIPRNFSAENLAGNFQIGFGNTNKDSCVQTEKEICFGFY